MKSTYLFLSIAIIFALSILGCSKSGNPLTPTNAPVEISSYGSLPVGVSDTSPDGTPSGGMGALGLFQLRIDPSTANAEMNSLRSSALTDVLETVDISNFLKLAPCSNCVKIKSVALDSNGNIVVSIGIKHPFPAGDPGKPITGRNRADLHVFNIEGIVISDLPGTAFPNLGKKVAGFNLLNADGYTGYLDQAIDEFFPTDASIHPYITHFDDYSAGNYDPANLMGFASVTDPPPSGNLVMAMGCDFNYQDYTFAIESATPVNFIYAVGCTYSLSAPSKSKRFQPEYRIPQHNKKSASEVAVAILNNNLRGEDAASTADIEIRIVDISHGVPVGAELNKMLSDSSVSNIMIELPGVMTTPITLPGSTPVSGTGHSPSDPLLYTDTITNTASALEGTYIGLVKVKDTYSPGQNTAPNLNGMDGLKRAEPLTNPLAGLFAIDEFATYQTFTVDVAPGNDPPIAILITNPDPANINEYQSIDFDATTSSDPDGTIVLYEFDFSWDGIEMNFTADTSNITGLASKQYTTAGTYTTGLRVTDNLGAQAYDYAVVDVQAGCVIHVDDDNVSGPWDGSPTHPYRWVQDGVDAAPNDCMVYVHPGTYNEDQGGPNSSGLAEVTITSKQNLTLHGDGLPTIVLHMITVTGRAAVHAYDSPGLVVEGIKIQLAYHYQSTIWLENCDDAIIRNCVVQPHQTGCHEFVRARLSDNLLVMSNTYDDIECHSVWSHFTVIDSCNNAVFTLNTARRRAHMGYNMYSTGNGQVYCYNSSNVEFSKNIFGDFYESWPSRDYLEMQIMYFYGGTNNTIRNNLIYDMAYYDDQTTAVSNDYAIIVNGSNSINIYNNTIDLIGINNPGNGVTYGIQLIGASNANLYNNIISNLKATQSGVCYGIASNSAVTQTYSDVWNLIGATTYRYSGLATEGTGGIDLDPMFVNPATANYHLQTGSPCKGTGMSGADMGCYGGSDPLP